MRSAQYWALLPKLPASEPAVTRLKAFEPFLANAPATGASKPDVTIVEFSDFQCPSCRNAAHFVDPIVAKHGEKVVVPPPRTSAEVEERLSHTDYEIRDFYLCLKDGPK